MPRVLIAAPTARPAQRYAAPAGTGAEPCAQAAPCSLEDAIDKATADDEVIVTAGHLLGGRIASAFPNQARTSTSTGTSPGRCRWYVAPRRSARSRSSGRKSGSATWTCPTRARPPADALYCGTGGEVDRVRATVIGSEPRAIETSGSCVVRDSLRSAVGNSAIGLSARGLADGQTERLRNVTAIAVGTETTGIRAELPVEPGTYNVDVENTIASGSVATSPPTKAPKARRKS